MWEILQLSMIKSMVSLQKCPFDAIMIINLPKNLERETMHRYGPNSFKLHRCLITTTSQYLYVSLAAVSQLLQCSKWDCWHVCCYMAHPCKVLPGKLCRVRRLSS